MAPINPPVTRAFLLVSFSVISAAFDSEIPVLLMRLSSLRLRRKLPIERIPSTGDLVVLWNDHSDLPAVQRKARTPFSVAISRDDGTTWEKAKTIDPNPKGWFCYTAIEFADGHLLLGHVAGDQTSGKHLATSRITRVPIAWIYE